MINRLFLRVLAVITAAVLMLCAAGCAETAEPADYDTGTGLTLTMVEGMEPFEADGLSAALTDGERMMTAVRHDYQQFADLGFEVPAMTVEEYAALAVELTGSEYKFSYDANGNYYTTYTAEVDGEEYFYYGIIVKGSDAFWLVTFTCPAGQREECAPLFTEWGASVEVE